MTYTWKDLEIDRGLEKIHTVEFNLQNENLELQPAMSNGKVLGMQPLSSMAKLVDEPENRVIAGINGDFYNMSNGEPLGFFMGNGKILTSPNSRVAFGLKGDGRTVYGKPAPLKRFLTVGDQEVQISHINRSRNDHELILYTEDYDVSTQTNDLGNEVVAEILEGDVKPGQTVKLRVLEMHENKGNTSLEEGQVVISATGDFKEELASLQPGSELTATFEFADESWEGVELAIGGNQRLIEDGKIVQTDDTAVHPRTAIGTKADGSIVMLEVDGRQPGFSEGVNYEELARILLDMGVVNAINVDGGGSATLITRLPGQTEAKVMNSPADGGERSTANGLLLVNKAPEGGPAAKLAISPVQERVLTGSSVSFQAAGVDEYGHPASIDGSPAWTIDSRYGMVDDNGVFTASELTGDAVVTASHDDIRGSAEVEVVDQLTELVFPVENATFQADQSEKLSVTALRNGQVIQADNESFEWQVEGPIGSINDDGVFTAADGTGLKGKITVSYGDVEASMDVNVGKQPVVLEDFENGLDRYKKESGARYVKSIASIETDEEYVRSGNGALKLEYDFTGKVGTSGSYLQVKEPSQNIEIPDYPEKISMWVYGDGNKHWLRAQLKDANGGAVPINFVPSEPGIDFVGWRYMEATVPQGRPTPLSMDMPVRYMETKNDNKNAGAIYVDNIRALYGPTTEDFTPPVIKDISPAESSVVTDNQPKIEAFGEAADYDPEEHPASTLIDPDKIRLYVDDVLVNHALYPPTGRINYTPNAPLADGTHKVQLKIRDLTGNRAEKEWFFDVNTGASKITYDHPDEVYVGNTSAVDIKAVKPSKISEGYIEFQLDTNKAENIHVVPNENLSAAQLDATIDEERGIVRIDFNELGEAGLGAEDTLAHLRYQVKTDANGDMKVNFVSGAFQLEETGEVEYSFYGQPVTAPIQHHLNLAWDEKGVAEGSTTTFTVEDEHGDPVEGASIQLTDGTDLGTTDEEGILKTDELTQSVAEYELQAVKETMYSPIETFVVSELTGSEIPYNVSVTMWEDTETTKAFNWHTHPGVDETVVEVVESDAFTDFNADQVMRFEGRSSLFNTYDTGTVRVHKAEAEGLKPGTEYTYRVGDGKDYVSEQGTFVTAAGTNVGTKFLFMGDSQASNEKGFALWGNIFEKALDEHPDTEFVVHGGDLVEDGYKENEWNMWFDAAKEELSATTIVPVVGNHEVTGTRHTEDYLAHFNHPQNGIDSLKGSHFSFDYNNAHVVVLNSEYDFEEQKEWLRNDLANNDKEWTFVAFHRGPYGSMYDSAHIRDAWTPIFDEFEVDVVMNGHDHVYVRTWPMKDREIAEDGEGTIYLVGGSTGPKFYQVVERDWQHVTDGEREQMYVAADIIDDKVEFEVKTINDRVVDRFTLVKGEGTGEESPIEGDPGEGDPGEGDPGEGDPGECDPGEGDPGECDPGEGKEDDDSKEDDDESDNKDRDKDDDKEKDKEKDNKDKDKSDRSESKSETLQNVEPKNGRLVVEPTVSEDNKEAVVELSPKQLEALKKQAKSNTQGVKQVEVELKSTNDAKGYALKVSSGLFANEKDDETVHLQVVTPLGSVKMPADVLGKNVKAKADVELHFKRTAGQGFVFNVEVDG
ncbi:hypothetical protein G4V62_18270, partial [Bacillaceae bacterium SIJ1]|uniref:phosphodiester glycosidase family protein n=1 Tax=Litoribacterium kuwaitense TaxID=1398745 RepID=UPI001BAD4255